MLVKKYHAVLPILAAAAMTSTAVFAAEEVFPLDAGPATEAGDAINETPNLWFVELSGAPTTEGRTRSAVDSEQRTFRANARKAGLGYTERYSYQSLFNGFSIEVSPSQLGKLSRIDGVKAIWPVETYAVPKTERSSNPDLFTALGMTGADIAQNSLGYTGAGVRVAIMDTGVDYDHPDLGGCFGDGCRVAFGYDLVGDAFNADPTSASYNPIAVPDDDPDDCNGHGTHVAGITGADGVLTGVAPGVTFGAYRVFGCEGSTTADIMIEAMELALADDMDVLNMSIGSAFQWPQYPTAQAATRLVNKGVVVVTSTGNSGTSGLYAAGAPGLGAKVIATASFDNSHVALSTFTISPDNTAIGYAPATGAPLPPTSGTSPMARTGTSASTADACNSLPAGSLTGHIALIRRGTCSFAIKSANAQAAGAIGVVLYNNVAGRFSPTVAGAGIVIPVVAISDTEGVLIDNRLAAGPVDLTWTDQLGTFVNPTGGLISSFSSYGLSPDLAVKPDIGAPGGLIFSTYPLESGAYATISGTSMASPHVAGAAALVLEARPNTNSQAMRGILQASADPKAWWGNPALGFLDNVHRQGAGMVDIDDAILSTTKIEPSKIATGESEAGPYSTTLHIENNAGSDVTYDLGHTPALSTGSSTFTPSFFLGNAGVTYGAASVLVPAGGTATVEVTITPATGPVGGMYGGYLVLTPQGGGQTYRVPYAGFVGDYQSKQVLVPTGSNFPWLARQVGTTFFNQAPGAVFTMQGNDIPYFLAHLDHQSRRLRIEIFATGGKNWHRAYEQEYLARNSTATSFFAYPFDGTTVSGKKTWTVPNGTYYAVMSVLKANGDDANPAHWETWASPEFVIARP